MPAEGLPERVRAERGVTEQTNERAKKKAEAQLATEQKATEDLARRKKRVWRRSNDNKELLFKATSEDRPFPYMTQPIHEIVICTDDF
jgi:hypothetical protein